MAEYEQVQHPLLIDLVLEQLFQNLEVLDLLRCRLVCKHWNHLVTKPLSQNQNRLVLIPNSDELYLFLNSFLESDNPQIWSKFQLGLESVAPNDSQLLFDAIGLFVKELVVVPGNSLCLVRLFKLLRSTPELQSLELEGLREMVVNELSRSVSRYLNYRMTVNRIEEFQDWASTQTDLILPQLKRLKIAVQIESGSPNLSFIFFQTIFKIFPNIVHLEVTCLDMAEIINTTIQGVIQSLEQSSILAKLTSLRIDDLDETGLEKLVELHSKGLRLKELKLPSFLNDVSSSTLENLLECQAESLVDLTLGGQYLQGGITLRLGNSRYPFVMPKLKVLNFTAAVENGRRINYIQTLVWELDFSSQMPILESLGLYYFTTHSYETMFPPGLDHQPYCMSLTQLVISGGTEYIAESNLILMGTLFRNVTDLTVTVRDGRCISTVFALWQKLRTLKLIIVSGIPKLDEWFTGVIIPSAITSPDKGLNEFQELTNETTGRLALTSLQDLQDLKIIIDLRQTMGGIHSRILPSDLTAMLAIRPLQNLKKLVINRSDITGTSVRILRRDLNLEKCVVGDRTGNIIPLISGEDEIVEQ